jgi:hypothetical protein
MRKSAVAICLFALASVLVEAQLPSRPLFHFDAALQPAARAAASLPTIGNAQPVDLLLDQSPEKRLAAQHVPERRPVFVSDGATAYLKFDGKDDFLALQNGFPPANELTVFHSGRTEGKPRIFFGDVRDRRVRP